MSEEIWDGLSLLKNAETTVDFNDRIDAMEKFGADLVPYLRLGLQHQDGAMVDVSAVLLGRQEDITAVPHLLHLAYKNKGIQSVAAVRTLKNDVFNEELLRLYISGDNIEKEQAALAMGRNKYADAMDTLRSSIIDKDKPVYILYKTSGFKGNGGNFWRKLYRCCWRYLNRLDRRDLTSDDRAVLIEIPTMMLEKGDKEAAPILRHLLYADRVTIKT